MKSRVLEGNGKKIPKYVSKGILVNGLKDKMIDTTLVPCASKETEELHANPINFCEEMKLSGLTHLKALFSLQWKAK